MKNNDRLKGIAELVILVLVILLVLYLIEKIPAFDFPKPESTSAKIVTFTGIFIMALLMLGLHELGHLLTGLAQGFRFALFVVGPLGVKLEDEKIKWYLNTNLGHYGGIAATTPANNEPRNAKKFARVIIAGPLISLLGGVILLGLSTLLETPWNIIIAAGGLISFALFLATTIPSKTGPLFTDRKRYQRLTRPGKAQQVELATLRIMGQYAQDDSYQNVDPEDINILIEDEEPLTRYFGWFNKLYQQMEQGIEPDAEDWDSFRKTGELLSKSMVTAMEKELEKARQ
jgi:Zn-dependent protease